MVGNDHDSNIPDKEEEFCNSEEEFEKWHVKQKHIEVQHEKQSKKQMSPINIVHPYFYANFCAIVSKNEFWEKHKPKLKQLKGTSDRLPSFTLSQPFFFMFQSSMNLLFSMTRLWSVIIYQERFVLRIRNQQVEKCSINGFSIYFFRNLLPKRLQSHRESKTNWISMKQSCTILNRWGRGIWRLYWFKKSIFVLIRWFICF